VGEPIRVLIAENDPNDAELLVRELRRSGFEPAWTRVDTEADYLRELVPEVDVVLSDYAMPFFDGLRALRLLRERFADTPFILVSGTVGEDTAVAAMKEGASDYLIKDRLTRLGASIRAALQQRRDRERRARAEAELRRFISASPAVIYALSVRDGALEHVWTSDNVARFTGHDVQEARGRDWWVGQLHPDDRERVLAAHPTPYDVEHLQLEYRFQRKDGSWFWVRDEKRLLRDDAGVPVEVVGCWSDVTEGKRAERRQAMQHAVTEVLADSSSLRAAAPGLIRAVCEALGARFGAVWEIDPHGQRLCCADVWQAPALAAAALEAETRAMSFAPGIGLPGRVWSSGTPLLVQDVACDPAFLRTVSAAAAGLHGAFGFPIRLRDQVVGVLDCLSPGRPEPEPELLVLLDAIGSQIGQFIEHRRADDQLRQSQKMEAIGQLAGGIAHDFNNIMGVILGYGELASRELGAEHRTQRRLAEMRKAAERAAALTRQILTFSRRQPIESRVCDLNDIVQDMETMLRRLIGEDVRLAVALGEGLGHVRADPGQLAQVVMNLAVNARDAMPAGGRLIIETSNADLDEAFVRSHPDARTGPHVVLAVGDTGTGMDPATLARVFEPFFTTKEAGKGTGLGLAVVYGIVTQGGGSLSVESEPGRGSTFRICLPRVDALPPGGPAAADEAEATGGSETVLLIEDEQALRDVVAETLRTAGYTVLEASGGKQALAMAAQSQRAIQLVITDVVLPGLSGTETAAHIRKLQPGARVLLMSGYADRLLEDDGSVKSGTPFLGKPFTIDALLLKVRAVLDRRAT
jgi:PAS domain S-box-containing protein